jgi:glycosyltransferase involved in cell wall biosynthesis
MMHIVLIDFQYYAYSIPLANALSNFCEVTLILPEQALPYRAMIQDQVHLRTFRKARLRYPSNLLMLKSIFNAIQEIKPLAVHLISWNLWMCMSLPVFPNIPLVSTIHDFAQHPGDEPIPLNSWQWRYADRVIVHAEHIKQQLLQQHQLPAAKIHVIPHGVYDFYQHWSQTEVSDPENRILFFGRIWEYKGLRYLMEAEPLITQQVPDARIVIAGEGEPLENYAPWMVNRDHYIIYNHRIPDEMIASLFQECRVVALPYTEASQSGVIAIAYAFNRPAVATNVGGLPESVDDGRTGILIPPQDAKSLADAIVLLLKDRNLWNSMVQNCQHKAETELSWPVIAQQNLAVYQQAWDDRRRK